MFVRRFKQSVLLKILMSEPVTSRETNGMSLMIFFMYRSVPLCTLQFPVDFLYKFCVSLLHWMSLSHKAELWALEAHVHKTTYGPLIDTALYVMLLMRANPLLGQVGGGWALEILTEILF
jgi:hypothetical protein